MVRLVYEDKDTSQRKMMCKRIIRNGIVWEIRKG